MTQNRRDPYVDSWRGVFHVLLLADHLPLLFPGMFVLIAGVFEFPGYVSVTEGFVLLSGYITGLVYIRVKREKGERSMWRKAAMRALTIYTTYVAATLLLLLLEKWAGPGAISWGSWRHLMNEPLASASTEVAGLLWQPSFLEILPMYSLFLLFAPIILRQLDYGQGWLVVSMSVGLWVANLFGLRTRLMEMIGMEGANLGYFNFLAWQILFVFGMVCGYRTYQANGPWLSRHPALPFAAYLLMTWLFACRHEVIKLPVASWWVERSTLGPLRLLNFACIAFLAVRFRGMVTKLIGFKGLAYLSRHSLQVFAFHLIPIYLAALPLTGKPRLPWWAQILFIGFCLLGLFYIAWVSDLTRNWFGKMLSRQSVAQDRTEMAKTK